MYVSKMFNIYKVITFVLLCYIQNNFSIKYKNLKKVYLYILKTKISFNRKEIVNCKFSNLKEILYYIYKPLRLNKFNCINIF